MASAASVGFILVAGCILARQPIVLVDDPNYLSITTVSGSAVFQMEENLEPVPGGATVSGWTVFVPTPEPHADAINQALNGIAHISTAEPPAPSEKESLVMRADPIDLGALKRRNVDL